MTYNQAHRKFTAEVKRVGGVTKAAGVLGCSKSAVCHIMKKRRKVGFRLSVKIEGAWRIPHDAWLNTGGVPE